MIIAYAWKAMMGISYWETVAVIMLGILAVATWVYETSLLVQAKKIAEQNEKIQE